jgi:hypothetical protein
MCALQIIANAGDISKHQASSSSQRRTFKVSKVADHLVVDALRARVAPQLEALEGLRAARANKDDKMTMSAWLLMRWITAAAAAAAEALEGLRAACGNKEAPQHHTTTSA